MWYTIGMNSGDPKQAPKPAAYDADGRPLYASPEDAIVASGGDPAQDSRVSHQFVHSYRMFEPEPLEIPVELRKKHDESVERYPGLNLSLNEFVIVAVPRHPAGYFGPVIITTVCIALVLSLLFNFPFFANSMGLSTSSYGTLMLAGIMLIILFLLGGYAAIWVFINNRFFLTNESVIQEIQTGLYGRKEQIVSLANVEDASYSQVGPLQTLLDYGSIRLSTEGDETSYNFTYVAHPKYHITMLNNAVEAFKNGRPVSASVQEAAKEPAAKDGPNLIVGSTDNSKIR